MNKGGTTNEINEEHQRGLENMKMNGQLFRQQSKLASVHIEVCHEWLKSAHLQFETESLIYAAQEQALANNLTKAVMWKQGGSSLCRLCQK